MLYYFKTNFKYNNMPYMYVRIFILHMNTLELKIEKNLLNIEKWQQLVSLH